MISCHRNSGVTYREYIWLNDLPVAVVDQVNTSTPQIYMVHTDHLGRPVLMISTAGAWVWNAIYDPFGAVSYIWSSPAVMDIRFPGQWFQLETGLSYNWHRHYDPSLGRYIQPDPLGLETLLSDGPSVYEYVGGNPLGYVDIDGLARRGGLRRGGERGATGGASGLNSDNPYKHCREDPTDPSMIECRNHQDGKRTRKKKPADWDQYKSKFCPTSLYPWMVLGGVATACLLQPEICIPAAAFSLPVAE